LNGPWNTSSAAPACCGRCWLRRIVHRRCLSVLWRYRRRKRNVARERSLDADPALQAQAVSGQPTAAQVLEGTEARQTLDEATAGLPPDQQEVLSLRHDEELTIRETAARLHTSDIKVRRTDKKALANMVHCLSERGIDGQ
jgi:RNA polymerase sigma factor (sigma-70 family)